MASMTFPTGSTKLWVLHHYHTEILIVFSCVVFKTAVIIMNDAIIEIPFDS
jgi:hypothetical protein